MAWILCCTGSNGVTFREGEGHEEWNTVRSDLAFTYYFKTQAVDKNFQHAI